MKLRALGVVVVLLATLGSPARASHPNVMCVDVGMNERYGMAGDDAVEYVRATIGTNDADHEPPTQEGCVPIESDFGGTEIDYEIAGAGDPDASDTPETPDMTCTVPLGANNCYVEPPPAGGGTQTIRAWIDGDHDNATVEADRTEGADQNTAPGDSPEPDPTDVMNWIWTHGDPPPEVCGPDATCSQRITIDYRRWRGTFFGRVFAEHESCGRRRVVVWRVIRGRGDERVAFTHVGNGRQVDWRIPTYEYEPGRRYYAVVKPGYVESATGARHRCEADTSPRITIE